MGLKKGTVIGIVHPGISSDQNTAYNGHEKKHALKFQTITSPDGFILHKHGPMNGRRHDWLTYVQSGIEVEVVCTVGDV